MLISVCVHKRNSLLWKRVVILANIQSSSFLHNGAYRDDELGCLLLGIAI